MVSSFPSLSLSLLGCEVSGLEQMVSVEYVSLPRYCGQQPSPLTVLKPSLGAQPSSPAVPSWHLSISPPSQPKPSATRSPPITSVCAQLLVRFFLAQ